jgi:tryptophanyl-tRNA synthetase
MSLTDGTAKMSKSNPAEGSRINVLDTPDEIAKKIKRCKTDTFEGLEFDNPDRPESTNLLTMYQLCTGLSREETLAACGAMRWGEFKPALTEAVIDHLIAHSEPLPRDHGRAGVPGRRAGAGRGRGERGGGEDRGGRQGRHGIPGEGVRRRR